MFNALWFLVPEKDSISDRSALLVGNCQNKWGWGGVVIFAAHGMVK